jgi:hypothetical protein
MFYLVYLRIPNGGPRQGVGDDHVQPDHGSDEDRRLGLPEPDPTRPDRACSGLRPATPRGAVARLARHPSGAHRRRLVDRPHRQPGRLPARRRPLRTGRRRRRRHRQRRTRAGLPAHTGRKRPIRHLRVHRLARVGRGRTTDRVPGDEPLGLGGPAGRVRRHGGARAGGDRPKPDHRCRSDVGNRLRPHPRRAAVRAAGGAAGSASPGIRSAAAIPPRLAQHRRPGAVARLREAAHERRWPLVAAAVQRLNSRG